MVKTTMDALEYAEAGCRTLMNKYQAEKLLFPCPLSK